MKSKKYKILQSVISIIFILLYLLSIFIEMRFFSQESFMKVYFGSSIILAAGYLLIIKSIQTKNNLLKMNNLHKEICKKYKTKNKYKDIYIIISEYKSSEDIRKILELKELESILSTTDINVVLYTVVIAALTILIDKINEIFNVFHETLLYILSMDAKDDLINFNSRITGVGLIFLILMLLYIVAESANQCNQNKFILNIINEVEKDICLYDVKGKNQNTKILEYLNTEKSD